MQSVSIYKMLALAEINFVPKKVRIYLEWARWAVDQLWGTEVEYRQEKEAGKG